MRIRKFNESWSLKNIIEEYFIDFVDEGMVKINETDNKYVLVFNFKLPKANTLTEYINNLNQSSEYIDDINVGVNRIKDKHEIDISFSNLDLKGENNFYLEIIDNTKSVYKKLTQPTFKSKLKNVKVLDTNDILRVYNKFNINGAKLWFTGFSGGQTIFDLQNENINVENHDPAKLLVADMSIKSVAIIRISLYKLDTDDYMIKIDNQNQAIENDLYLIKNGELEEFLDLMVNKKYDYWSVLYPAQLPRR
jgi:hypothetical protein